MGKKLGIAAGILALLLILFLVINRTSNTEKWKEVIADENRQEVLLPDGTKVLLSRGSKIVFPREFNDRRNIHIDGDAYLEVTSNSQIPLEIVSPHLITRVMESSFLIDDETGDTEAELQLIEGKVTVINRIDSVEIEVNEGESARYRLDRLMRFTKRYDQRYDWYFGSLQFKGEQFDEVADRLEKRFGIDLTYNEELGTCGFHGSLEEMNTQKIIETIAGMFGAELQTRGRRYELVGGKCG